MTNPALTPAAADVLARALALLDLVVENDAEPTWTFGQDVEALKAAAAELLPAPKPNPALVGTTPAQTWDFVTGAPRPTPAPLLAGETVVFAETGRVATLVEVTDRAWRNGMHAWDRWTLRGADGSTFSATSLFFRRA